MNDIDRERMIKEIGRCLSGVEDLLLGYLYGSFLVRSDFHDIDIALLVSGEREPYEPFKYCHEDRIRSGAMHHAEVRGGSPDSQYGARGVPV